MSQIPYVEATDDAHLLHVRNDMTLARLLALILARATDNAPRLPAGGRGPERETGNRVAHAEAW